MRPVISLSTVCPWCRLQGRIGVAALRRGVRYAEARCGRGHAWTVAWRATAPRTGAEYAAYAAIAESAARRLESDGRGGSWEVGVLRRAAERARRLAWEGDGR